jgi:hypothetical protein
VLAPPAPSPPPAVAPSPPRRVAPSPPPGSIKQHPPASLLWPAKLQFHAQPQVEMREWVCSITHTRCHTHTHTHTRCGTHTHKNTKTHTVWHTHTHTHIQCSVGCGDLTVTCNTAHLKADRHQVLHNTLRPSGQSSLIGVCQAFLEPVVYCICSQSVHRQCSLRGTFIM